MKRNYVGQHVAQFEEHDSNCVLTVTRNPPFQNPVSAPVSVLKCNVFVCNVFSPSFINVDGCLRLTPPPPPKKKKKKKKYQKKKWEGSSPPGTPTGSASDLTIIRQTASLVNKICKASVFIHRQTAPFGVRMVPSGRRAQNHSYVGECGGYQGHDGQW